MAGASSISSAAAQFFSAIAQSSLSSASSASAGGEGGAGLSGGESAPQSVSSAGVGQSIDESA